MPYQFENRYYTSDTMLREYVTTIACKDIRNASIFFFLIYLLLLVAAGNTRQQTLMVIFAGCAVIAAISSLAVTIHQFCLRRRPQQQPPKHYGRETVVRFGARICLTEGSKQLWADYEQITKVQHLQSFSVLKLGKQDAIVLSTSGFTKGSGSEFWRFLSQKRPDLKIKV